MAVGGLPSKRQGRLGRPKDHRRPPVTDFSLFFANSHSSLHLLPSSTSPSPSPSSPSPLPPSPAPSPPPPSPAPSPPPPSPAPSPSPSPPPPTPSPTPSPSQPPFLLLFTTSCETHTVSGFSESPTGPGSIPAYPYKALPFWPSPPATSSAPSGLFQDQP